MNLFLESLRSALASLRPRPVVTIGDLLEHVPFRHEDFRQARRMADMQPGEEATIVCTVIDVRQRPTRRRNLVIVEARVRDASGPGVVIWFNQRYVARQLSPGTVISVRGERRASIGAEIAAKSHEVMDEGDDAQHTSGLVPIYRATESLSSRRIRTLVDEQLGHAGDAPDALPSDVRRRHRLPLRRDAIMAAHRPRTPRDAEWARRRLAFEELFLLQVGLIRHRRELESAAVAPALGRPGELSVGLPGTLPFTPTAAQIRAMAEVDADVARTIPMQRSGALTAGRALQMTDSVHLQR